MASITKIFTLKGIQNCAYLKVLKMDSFYTFQCKHFRITHHEVMFGILFKVLFETPFIAIGSHIELSISR
jgi:hypothetical protein